MSEAEFTSFLESILWPLLAGGVAAFAYLILLSAAYRRSASLYQLCREVAARREKFEKRKDKEEYVRIAIRLVTFEKELHALLQKKGLIAGPPAPLEKKSQLAGQKS